MWGDGVAAPVPAAVSSASDCDDVSGGWTDEGGREENEGVICRLGV